MVGKSTYTVAEIQAALVETIENLFKTPRAEIRSKSIRSLGDQAREMRVAILANIIEVHLLKDIIIFALDEVVSHAEAIDTLGANKASILHARYIEEISAVVKFIVYDPKRYEELSWRWKSFSVVHVIRNRLLNLKIPIDREMQNWIDQNINRLKQYVNKRFDTNSQTSIKMWQKYNNWLCPIKLSEIFETTGRNESYLSAEYDLNSHAVHFSPLVNNQYLEMELPHHTAVEAMTGHMPLKHILGFCRDCLAVVSNTKILRTFHAKNMYLDTYKMIEEKPLWFIEVLNENRGYANRLIKFIFSPNRTIEEAIEVVLGPEPKDPLVIRVDG